MTARNSMLVAVLLLAAAVHVPAEDWPNWRGPDYSGISKERLPEKFPGTLPVSWRTNVGIGFSTVSVQDNRVLTMGNRDGTDTVFCLDAGSGRTLWKHEYACELDPRYYEGGPSATPTIHGGAVYTLSKKGHVFCLDLTSGEVRWQRQLAKDHGFELPEWSFASSPVVFGDKLLLNVGREGTALAKDTGKTLWKPSLDTAGYASFVPFEHGGATHLLFSAKALLAIDARVGRTLWSHNRPSSRDVNAADPIVIGNRIVVSSSRGTELLEVGKEPETIWNERGLRWYFNAGVLIEGHLYSINGTTHRPSKLTCTDAATGKKTWEKEGFGSGALMAAEKTLILFDKGTLTLFAADAKEFRLLHRQQIMGGKCWTVPVLANGRIYCRNAAGELACASVVRSGL